MRYLHRNIITFTEWIKNNMTNKIKYHSVLKKEGYLVICDNIDSPGGYSAK
jgi:hypothetical protein